MSRGLHDDQTCQTVGDLDHGVARLSQVGRQRRDLARDGVETADGAVVGVTDRDRAVRQNGDAQRVLQQGLICFAVTVTKVEEALTDMGLNLKTVLCQADRAQG